MSMERAQTFAGRMTGLSTPLVYCPFALATALLESTFNLNFRKHIKNL